MKPPSSALPLPRYVWRLPLKGKGWSYRFDVHNIYIKAGCPLQREGLGTDYARAVERAETSDLRAQDVGYRMKNSLSARPAFLARGSRGGRLAVTEAVRG
jgi:hypothetical protein